MKSDINVTPLIDVLLVLLIIFMIVAPAPPRAIDTSVPRPPDDSDTKPNALVVEVRSDGFTLNTTPVWTPAELEERLRGAFEVRDARTLFVRAAGDVPYHRVMEALDVARGAGAQRIGMLEPESEARRAAGTGAKGGR